MIREWIEEGGRLSRRATLGQRIAFSFAIIMTAMALIYTTVLYYNFKWVELTLSGEHMADQLHAKEKAILSGVMPQVNPGVWLYSSHPKLNPVPEQFQQAPLGFSEQESSPSYFIWREQKDGYDFMLVKDQTTFEDMEKIFRKVIALMAVLVSLSGLAWGLFLYRVIMNPVRRLSQAVEAASQASHYQPLAAMPRRDDITILAQCCDAALARLHQALAREQTFTGDVSHELRNPLNVIEGSIELLEMTPLTEKQHQIVKRAQTAANDMHQLVDDFLAFARDAQMLGSSTADTLPALFCRMRDMWTAEAERRGITFRTQVLAECGGVYSPVLLGSVMNNLIRNAIHYTESGEVVLEEIEDGFAVRDHAGGIAPEKVTRLFEPFVRGSAGRRDRSSTGYGLGLSIVMRLCRRCHWQIRHENIPGGSRFVVTLKTTTPESV